MNAPMRTQLPICAILSMLIGNLFVTGCLPRAAWQEHGGFKLRIPATWGSAAWAEQGRMYSRAETSAFIIIEPVANAAELKQKITEAVTSKKAAYPGSRVTETILDRVGGVSGVGTKVERHSENGQVVAEDLFFMPEGTSWMLTAGCASGSIAVWDEYHTALATLSRK
jgi:hypothetical protein